MTGLEIKSTQKKKLDAEAIKILEVGLGINEGIEVEQGGMETSG
jgi:hypothetical protein